MKKKSWFERLIEALGGGETGKRRAAGSSKHGRGKQKPRYWLATKRKKRKRQTAARRACLRRQAQRGKR